MGIIRRQYRTKKKQKVAIFYRAEVYVKGFHIVGWVQWLKEHPTAKNKRRKSFVKELGLLKNVLNWYKDFLNEDFNVPVTKKHTRMCFFKTNAPRRPDHFIKPEDSRRWIDWLREHRSNPTYWRLASFMLLTGARVGGSLWNEMGCCRFRAGSGKSYKKS